MLYSLSSYCQSLPDSVTISLPEARSLAVKSILAESLSKTLIVKDSLLQAKSEQIAVMRGVIADQAQAADELQAVIVEKDNVIKTYLIDIDLITKQRNLAKRKKWVWGGAGLVIGGGTGLLAGLLIR